jgi:hypothetical protein
MKWVGVGLAGLVGVVLLAIAIVHGVTSDDEIHALWLYIRSVPARKRGGK